MTRRTAGKKFEEGELADKASASTKAACERAEDERVGKFQTGPRKPKQDNPQSD